MSELPIPRTTIPALVGEYKTAMQEIEQGYELLKAAEARLERAFLPHGRAFDLSSDSLRHHNIGKTREQIDRTAWKALIERMEIRSVMSIKAAKEMDEQVEQGKMPPITEANILATMEGIWNRIPEFMEAAVVEVFDWLRPSGWRRSEYKTNQKNAWELTDTIIVTWAIEIGFRGGFRVRYGTEQNINCLDRVFCLLEGKPAFKTYYGPLYEAIGKAEDGVGETEYFKFRAYKNGNLHLKIKRADLLAKLNAVAGGMRLKDEKFNRQPSYENVKRPETGDPVKDLQFYETPDALADRLVEMARLEHGHVILEPSAGHGAIVRAIWRALVDSALGERPMQSGTIINAVEIDPEKAAKLQALVGPEAVVIGDFLELNKANAFDRILANPPFCGGQDIAHLRKMYDSLKIGGRLVCVTSVSWLFKTDHVSREFRHWLTGDEDPIQLMENEQQGFKQRWIRGTMERLPNGSFKESGTMVAALVVTIDKTNNETNEI